MYLNDLQRPEFYSIIGLDAKQFDRHVIIKINEGAGTLFPVIFDVKNPKFFKLLDLCGDANQSLISIEQEERYSLVSFFKKLTFYFNLIFGLLQLYFLPSIETKYIRTKKYK